MKQWPIQRSTIAWFRLYEYLERGERERALFFCRLISHSVESRAFGKKLEADLVATFNRVQAYQLYLEAAALYELENNPFEAVLVYTMLASLSTASAPPEYQALRRSGETAHPE